MSTNDTKAPSLPLTVHLGEGVSDELAAMLEKVTAMRNLEHHCENYEQLHELRRQMSESAVELASVLVTQLRTTEYDGDVLHLFKAFDHKGIGFRFGKSGYCGGIIPDTQGIRPTVRRAT